MEIKVKNIFELIKEELITERDINGFPRHTMKIVGLIFPGLLKVTDFTRDVIGEKITRQEWDSIWSYVVGPVKNVYILVFRKSDFERKIKSILDKMET